MGWPFLISALGFTNSLWFRASVVRCTFVHIRPSQEVKRAFESKGLGDDTMLLTYEDGEVPRDQL